MCTLPRIVGCLLFLSSLILYQTQNTFFLQTSKKLTETQILTNMVAKLQKDIEKISRTINDQSKWKEYLEERNQLLKALPVSDEHPEWKKHRNPHVMLDSIQIDCRVRNRLLVLVSSNAPHFSRRNIIRETWGNRTNWSTKEIWKVIFVLGGTKDEATLKSIREEGEKYKDIMLEDVTEGFYQLSYKVMIGLHWAYTTINFDFILKCDDDIFVQIDRLTRKLSSEYKNEGYIGNVMYNQPIMRSGRYGLTKEEHEKDVFDPYCSGGGFILSHSVVGKIIPSFNWESPLKIDDAYIGQLVFKTGVKALHIPHGFYMWNNWCEYNEHLLVSHPVKKIQCMKFLLSHSLIDNGKLVDDIIKNQKHIYGPKATVAPQEKT